MISALQVCPNDHPPFLAICGCYHTVLTELGFDATTVFFESRVTTDDGPPRHYVRQEALRRFAATLGQVDVVLTHRYKGYRAALAVPSRLQISIAHEYGFFARKIRRWRQRFDGKRVVFAGVSTPVADEIARDVGGTCETLPNPIDIEAMQAALLSREEARHALKQNASDYLIGVIGRLHPKKNPLLAVDGFRRAAGELGPQAKLIFVGDGELEDRLQRTDGVRLTGFVPDASRYLRAFDLILSTTSSREAFGMSLVEALVAGVPVVCTDHPGPREVLGEVSRFVPDEDPQALAAALVQAMNEAAAVSNDAGYRRVVERFSVSAVTERLRRVIG